MIGVGAGVATAVHARGYIVGVRNQPVGAVFSARDAEIVFHPSHDGGAIIHGIGAGGGMLGVEILIGRNVAEHILVTAVRMNSVFEEHSVVPGDVTEHVAVVEVALLASIPMVHERDVAILPI